MVAMTEAAAATQAAQAEEAKAADAAPAVIPEIWGLDEGLPLTTERPWVAVYPSRAPVKSAGGVLPADDRLEAKMAAITDTVLNDKADRLQWPALWAEKSGIEGGLPPHQKSRSSSGGG
jgi:hypothetical protein